MKITTKAIVYLVLFTTTIFISCSDDSEDSILQEEAKLTSVVFEASKNDLLAKDITATIDLSKKEVLVTLPFGVDIKSLTPTIISKQGTTTEFTPDFRILKVKDSDGFTKESYTIKVKNGQNSKSILESFVFSVDKNPSLKKEIYGTIDESAKTIKLNILKGTDITSLTPTIGVSENATITPDKKQDFSKEVQYKVTSEDGKSITTYKVIVTYINNTESSIEKFHFLASENTGLAKDLVGELQEYGNKNIFVVNVDFDTNVTALIPNIELSQGATVDINGAQDFSKTVVYKVTSEDGKKVKEYHVVTANPDKAALIAIYNANYTGMPDTMAFTWDITEPDLDKWEGVGLNDEKSRVSTLFFSLTRVTELPEELGNLTELTSFQLSGFTNPELPKSFKNLQKITFLNFSTNSDPNTGWESIPSQIFELKELKTLSLNNYRISEISDDIVKLKDKLRSLMITENKVKITTISDEMENMEKLVSLTLTNNTKDILPDNICELKQKYEAESSTKKGFFKIKLDNDICN